MTGKEGFFLFNIIWSCDIWEYTRFWGEIKEKPIFGMCDSTKYVADTLI